MTGGKTKEGGPETVPPFDRFFRPPVQETTAACRDPGERGAVSQRTIWPIGIGYFEASRAVVAWCELRADFRTRCTARMVSAEVLVEPCTERRAVLLARWREKTEREGWEGHATAGGVEAARKE